MRAAGDQRVRRLSTCFDRLRLSPGALAPVALALVALAIAASAASAGPPTETWTRFRGPDGSGVSPEAFNAPITESDIRWKVDLPGVGHSSPVLWGDKIYLTCGDPSTADRIVLCLNAADGSVAWRQSYHSNTFHQHNDNSYASASPAVDEAGVYVAWTTPTQYTLLALDHAGKERWRKDLGPFKSLWGSGASPVAVNGLVVVSDDQEGEASWAFAFDDKTGAERWRVARASSDKAADSTPCIYRPAGAPAELILTSKASGMTALDLETGHVAWNVPKACPARTVGSPIIAGGLIVAPYGEGSNNRQLVAVRPPASAGGQPEIAYKLSRLPPYVPTPLYKGGLLFLWADNGVVTCVKPETGEKVWSEKVGGAYYGSPVCAGDTLWCMSRKGELVGVSASDHYHLVGRLDLGEATQATPALGDGRMFLRTESHLICVGKK